MPVMRIDTSEFQTAAEDLYRRAMDCSVPNRAFAAYMRGSVVRNFEDQGRPTKWRPLKVKTLLARYMRNNARRKNPRKMFKDESRTTKNGGVIVARNGVGAVSTVGGFLRSGKTGKVLRSRHQGLNYFAPAGKVFTSGALASVLKGKILQDTGVLRGSISARFTGVRGEVGTNLKYAATHQFGDAERKIAARPFLAFQDEDADQYQDFLVRWLRDGRLS